MKKLLKSEICGSINSVLFTEKSNISAPKKINKKKTEEKQNIALPKRTLSVNC